MTEPSNYHDAEHAAQYLLERTIEIAGTQHWQGNRDRPLPCNSDLPTVRRFSEERFFRIPDLAVKALIRWAEGQAVELLTSVPEPSHVLELQARGARCVSLLPEGRSTEHYASGLHFAIHDLCHLGKFMCSDFYEEQVGFFSALARAIETKVWQEIEPQLDPQWLVERNHVIADMNGSSVFLFAAFKMKLKMAARRRAARILDMPARTRGPLDPYEVRVFRELLEAALDACALVGAVREAAIATSTRRDCPLLATRLADHFRQSGEAVLARRGGPQAEP